MFSFKSIRCLVLLTLVNEIVTFDLCGGDSSKEIVSYPRNAKSQRCACDANKCVRKCCKMGFSLDGAFCVKSNSSDIFKVPFYTNETVAVGVLEIREDLKVGLMECPFYLLNSSNPEDSYYVQENGDLFVYSEFVGNDFYCLDDLDGFRVFLCFSEPNLPGKKFVVSGMSNMFFYTGCSRCYWHPCSK